MFNCPEAVVLTPDLVCSLVRDAGFENIQTQDLILGLTKTVTASKPSS
jgi:hypothetical protein